MPLGRATAGAIGPARRPSSLRANGQAKEAQLEAGPLARSPTPGARTPGTPVEHPCKRTHSEQTRPEEGGPPCRQTLQAPVLKRRNARIQFVTFVTCVHARAVAPPRVQRS